MEKLLNSSEACEVLMISKSKLFKLTMNREISHKKIHGRLRFEMIKLRNWLEEQTVEVLTKFELEQKADKLGRKNG